MVSTISIVSLSDGVIGRILSNTEVDLGIQRLKIWDLNSCLLAPFAGVFELYQGPSTKGTCRRFDAGAFRTITST